MAWPEKPEMGRHFTLAAGVSGLRDVVVSRAELDKESQKETGTHMRWWSVSPQKEHVRKSLQWRWLSCKVGV